MTTTFDFATLTANTAEQATTHAETPPVTSTDIANYLVTPTEVLEPVSDPVSIDLALHLLSQTNADFGGVGVDTHEFTDEHDSEVVVAQVTLCEPYGYPSVYSPKALGEATYADILDLNKVMPDQPRLGWLANAKNWSVLSTNDSPEETAKMDGAADWFGGCLAAVGGFFVTNPVEADMWPDDVVVPTPYGKALARRSMSLWSTDGTINTSQYVFVQVTENTRPDLDPVHNYMLRHLARMIGGSNSTIHQALSDARLVSMLREGLDDPDIRWYANLPSFFVQMFMTNPSSQHRVDSSYNSSSWFNKVRYNRQVINEALTHYKMVLATELDEDDSIDDNEMVARAMMLQVRQRISSSNEVREARLKSRHSK